MDKKAGSVQALSHQDKVFWEYMQYRKGKLPLVIWPNYQVKSQKISTLTSLLHTLEPRDIILFYFIFIFYFKENTNKPSCIESRCIKNWSLIES